MMKKWILGLVLGAGSASAQGSVFSPLTEVCSQALDIRNYSPQEQPHLIRGQGTGGWLFGEQDFRSYSPVLNDVPELKRLSDVLSQRNTTLLVLYLPPRPVLAASHLDFSKSYFKGVDLAALKASYDGAVQAVNAAGIYSPNILDLQKDRAPGAEFFFPRDHHLNLTAMDVVAGDLAKYILQKQLLSEEAKTVFELQSGSRLMTGSYNYVSNQLCHRFVLPSRYAVVTSKRKEDAGLLDDAAPSVVLAGDSNVFRDGGEESLAALLRHKLQADVLNVGIQGGGPTSSLENYILSQDFREHPPRVLIWEMDAGYDLSAFFKQIIPAVRGECSAPAQQFTLVPTQKTVIKPTQAEHYFVFRTRDPAVRNLQVDLGFVSGEKALVELSHTDREDASSLFYFEPRKVVTNITLVAHTGAGAVEVTECALND